MKKTLTLAISLALLGAVLSPNAFASVKPKSKCFLQGQIKNFQGKKYTCIKSGKKLVWNKGVIIAKPNPQPVITPTPKPTPAALISPLQSKDDVSRKIDQIRIDSLLNPSSTMPNLVFLFQGETSSEVETKTRRSLINAIPVYEKLGFKVTDALVLVARDIDWLKKELVKFNCDNNRPLPQRPGFYYGRTCTDGNGAVTSVHWEAEKFSDGLDGLYFNHIIPHEYFHQIQEQLTPFGNADFPKWFWEGSAQFFTNQAWASWNSSYSYNDWYHYWWTKLRPDLGPSACKKATINLMSDPSTTGIEGVCAYSKGQLVVEYLVSKYGLDKYRKLYTQNSIIGWANFNIVFKNVTGDELTNFYKEAEEFITTRGW
jgi:hypothetical protein